MNKEKMANNILELMGDPTKIPVERRLYFGPEEILDNKSYEQAKMDARSAYGDQRYNADMYPIRNRVIQQREDFIMDRKALIASFDVLSQAFKKKDDPIATDLRTMAVAVSKMPENELVDRIIQEDVSSSDKEAAETFKCPHCGTKVLKQTGYCVKCKKKVKPKKEASENLENKEEMSDLWNREASNAVIKALRGEYPVESKEEDTPEEGKKEAGKIKGPGKPDGTGPMSGTEDCPVTKEKEDKKEAGKTKGPGKPDGTGPMSGTEDCPVTKEKEDKKEAGEKDYETEPGRQPQEEGDIEEEHKEEDTPKKEKEKGAGQNEPPTRSKNKKEENWASEESDSEENKESDSEENKESDSEENKESDSEKNKEADSEENKEADKVVDTNILANVEFDGIELNNPMASADIQIKDNEKDRLDNIFKASELESLSESDKEKLDQLFK